MKILKKIGLSFALLCMMLLSMAIVVFAADGTLQFSDPTTTAGAEVTVDVKMATGGDAIGDGNATLTYDTSKLEFLSGTNASGGNGTVNLTASGTGTETELSYSIVFKALAEGIATVEVSDYTAYLYSDEKLNLTTGSSTVTIGAGDATAPTTATSGGGSSSVTINGTTYTIYEAFSDSALLSGFTKTTVAYDGVERQCAKQENGELYLFFLNDASNATHMALYDSKTEVFCFTETIDLSDDLYILLNDRGDGSNLPSEFQKTTVTINGNEFPAWQDTSNTDFYLMYALSSNGQESFYRYDQQEDTYQRYKIPEETKDNTTLSGTLGKIQDFVSQYFMLVLIVAVALVFLLLVVFITLSVKLHHRNRELDELYDGDYGLDIDKTNDEYYEDDDDEFYDDDEDSGDYDEDDEYYDDDEYYEDDDEYDDDDEDDEYDEVIPKSRSGKNSKKSKDDYQVNFVDI